MKALQHNSTKTLKASFLTLLICLVGLGSFAQQNKQDNALLWKIEGNGLDKPSYLFGTTHMICEDKYQMPAKVKNAMDLTEQSYLEINLADPNFAKEAQSHMKSEQPLSAVISAADYKYVDSVLKTKLKMELKQVEHIKPMLIMSSIMQASFRCKVISFEEQIIKHTKAANKSIAGLSSIEEQYSFLEKIFKTKDFVPYLKSLNDIDLNTLFATMYEAYNKEDLQQIDQLMLEFYRTDPDGYRQLLPIRNHLWADRMPDIMKQKASFFGVGCGHLLGTEGLVSLLRGKGYTVTPIQ